MRGNHILLGRNDFTDPEPMALSDIERISKYIIRLSPGYKTWYEVLDQNEIIGFVSLRVGHQYFRLPDANEWIYVIDRFSHLDPFCGRAVLALLNEIERIKDARAVSDLYSELSQVMKKFGVVQLKVWHDQRETTMWIEPDSTVFINGQQQPATGAQVADEMVQRALSAWYTSREKNERGLMRAALEAALAQRKI